MARSHSMTRSATRSTTQSATQSGRRRAARAVSPQPCGVCGSAEVAVDEVFEGGLWLLSECRRCENRWTEGPLGPRGPVARQQSLAVEEHVAAA